MTTLSTRRTAGERAHATITHELIPLTCNEIGHLFINLPSRARNGIHHLLHWSRWRRRHQARAHVSHDRLREATPP
jgi:hypothetical protein